MHTESTHDKEQAPESSRGIRLIAFGLLALAINYFWQRCGLGDAFEPACALCRSITFWTILCTVPFYPAGVLLACWRGCPVEAPIPFFIPQDALLLQVSGGDIQLRYGGHRPFSPPLVTKDARWVSDMQRVNYYQLF